MSRASRQARRSARRSRRSVRRTARRTKRATRRTSRQTSRTTARTTRRTARTSRRVSRGRSRTTRAGRVLRRTFGKKSTSTTTPPSGRLGNILLKRSEADKLGLYGESRRGKETSSGRIKDTDIIIFEKGSSIKDVGTPLEKLQEQGKISVVDQSAMPTKDLTEDDLLWRKTRKLSEKHQKFWDKKKLESEKILKDKTATMHQHQKSALIKIGATFIPEVAEIIHAPEGVWNLIKNPKNITKIPKGIALDVKDTIHLARTDPLSGIAKVGADVFTWVATGGGIKLTGKLTKIAKDIYSKSYRKIKTTSLGIKKIKNVKGIGDIEIIPEGAGRIKLDVKPKKFVKESKISKKLKEKPKLPPATNVEKRIIKIVKKFKDTITGSYSREVFLKKKFTTKHKDLDILTKNRPKLIKELKKEFGKDIIFRKKKFSIVAIYKGRAVADLVMRKFGEAGFVKKYGWKTVEGLKIANPKGILASKIYQMGIGKRGKVLKDIKLSSGKKVGFTKAQLKGAYGYTKKELDALVGMEGAVTTSQIGLLGKGIFKPSQLKLRRWFHANPPTKTGMAQMRISRLGISKKRNATLREILTGQFTLKATKPQILIFPKEKIFKAPSKLTREKMVKTKGFVVPKFSSELEIILGDPWVVKKVKSLAYIRIHGKKVPIFEVKKVKMSKGSEIKFNSLKSITEGLTKINNKFIKFNKKGKLNKKDLINKKKLINEKNSLMKKRDSTSKSLNKNLKSETGIDYLSATKKYKKQLNIRKLTTDIVPAIRIKRPTPRPRPTSKPRPRVTTRIKPRPRITPRPKPRVTTRIKPRPRITPRPKPRVTTRIKPRPRITPRPRPTPRPNPPLRIRIKKKKLIKRKVGTRLAYDVYGKSKGKFIKLNKKPLLKTDALNRGSYAIDHSTGATFKIKSIGSVKEKSLGRITRIERGSFARRKNKLRHYRIQKGKRIVMKNRYIEKRGKPRINTRGEKRGLSLMRMKKRLVKPITQKRTIRRRKK